MSTLPLSTQFRDNIGTWSGLSCLQTGTGERFMYTLGLCSDLLLEKMNQAVKIRFPGLGDPSQLPYLAADRVLSQGVAETNAAFIARLTSAFPDWKLSGSRRAILKNLQAYATGLQPGVAASLPEMAIVGGNADITTWDTIRNGTPTGSPPEHMTVLSNFSWDGAVKPWRSWLLLYMYQVATGLSGAAATYGAVSGSSGGTGHNVGGVWVPDTATVLPINPVVRINGLSGITSAQVGQWLTISGSSHAVNNGTFPIIATSGATSVFVVNNNNVADAGSLSWSIGYYPWIGPGPVWGAPGYTFGQGASPLPPVDRGSNVNGVWQPTTDASSYGFSLSWGLSCNQQTIDGIRTLVKRWKQAGAYYPNIIVAFDGGTGVDGSAFSPWSDSGNGNPDGTFGNFGTNSGGVWRPTRLISSPYDCYCLGTGSRQNCTVENVT